MAIGISDFWKLLIESGLASVDDCQKLAARWGNVKGAAEETRAKRLAEWLVSGKVLTVYQAQILLAGRTGPFFYGRYRVQNRIQSGAVAGAFQAIHVGTNHPVLLHFLTNPSVHDPQTWVAIAQQTKLRSMICEPHLLRYFEAVDAGSHKFLVSEDVRGKSLDVCVGERGRLPVSDAARLGRAMAMAIAALHQQRQVHAEVMPQAAEMDAAGFLKLIHSPAIFPGPVVVTSSDEATAQRADYWAPELAQPGVVPDQLTDIYALGCCLYFLLTGEPPFAGGSVSEKLARHAVQPIRSLEAIGVPAELAQIVAYAMAKNRAVRFQRADLIAEQLRAFVDPAQVAESPPRPAPTLESYEQRMLADVAVAGGGGPVATAMPIYQAPTTPAAVQSVPMPAVHAQPVSGQVVNANGAIAPALGSALNPVQSVMESGSLASGSPPEHYAAVGPVSPPAGPAKRYTVGAEKLRQMQRPKRSQLPLILISSGIAIVLVLGGIVLLSQQKKAGSTVASGESTNASKSASAAGVVPAGSSNASSAGAGGKAVEAAAVTRPSRDGTATVSDVQLVADDGKSLWVSPTSGPAIDLQYVPPGGQFYIHLRPAALIASGSGDRLLEALGPQFSRMRTQWEAESGVELRTVDRLVGTLFASEAAPPRFAWVVYLKEAVETSDLAAKWQDVETAEQDGHEYFKGKAWAYLVPERGEGKVFVMVAPSDVKETFEAKGLPPVLRADLQRLIRESDQDRHVTLCGAPNFLYSELFREGRSYYFGDGQRVGDPLKSILGDDLQAVSLSMHLDGNFYWEIRLVSNQNVDRFRMADDLRKRLEQLPDQMFDYVIRLGTNPYWEKVRFQLPQMIRFAHKMSRVGVEAESAILNGLLPDYAAHNLVFGGELLIASTPGAAPVAAAAKPSASYASIEELLDKYRTKVSFEANSLEFAIQDIAKDVAENVRGLPFDFKIKIIGEHLQLDGITRNQTVRNFNQADKSISEILTAIVMKANPVTTVKEPSEADQKLLWVIADDPAEPGKKIVLITTRQMSEKNKYTLPSVFRPKP